ncbi:MAG: metal ABC transporter ATP-binding protein [Actinomycetaceae bacterium]|nr:metal ABC transporter ATP-binding protein [Actinomycetaceae bacterium]
MSQPTKKYGLDIAELVVDYGKLRALSGVNLQVEQGSICGIVGQNGSGKSTMFKAVLGLVHRVEGTVNIDGYTSYEARQRGLVSYVPQSEEIDKDFPISVYDVVMMGRYGYMGALRRPKKKDREAVEHALMMVGIDDLAHRQIGALSGGQRKRAFVARGIAQGASVMLLDEPFAGVDKPSETTIISLLHTLRDMGKTILVSTHDLASLTILCDSVALLYRKVCFFGEPKEALQPNNLALAFGGAVAVQEGTL